MKASLIWDHKNDLRIPVEMGLPRADQMQGTIKENLCEVGGRVCYDSMGTGRDTKKFHSHLVEVAHWSVYEHARLELGFNLRDQAELIEILLFLVGQPGIEIAHGYTTDYFGKHDETLTPLQLVVNVNLRHILDWNKRDLEGNSVIAVFDAFGTLAKQEVPLVMNHLVVEESYLNTFHSQRFEYRTLFLRGSRGFSHEMVRHRYSMSQRSTRFCDESSGEWIKHPLLEPYLNELAYETGNTLDHYMNDHQVEAQELYDEMIRIMEPKLIAEGKDKLTARKQARGAARGYLGNALATELVFTAPLSGWHDMIRQRHNPAADGEIYEIFKQVKEIIGD